MLREELTHFLLDEFEYSLVKRTFINILLHYRNATKIFHIKLYL